MCDQSLAAIGSKGSVIVDGPFAANPIFLSILADLRQNQNVFASALRDGTPAGAAILALMEGDGRLPRITLDLAPIAPPGIAGLEDYARKWPVLAQQDQRKL